MTTNIFYFSYWTNYAWAQKNDVLQLNCNFKILLVIIIDIIKIVFLSPLLSKRKSGPINLDKKLH